MTKLDEYKAMGKTLNELHKRYLEDSKNKEARDEFLEAVETFRKMTYLICRTHKEELIDSI